LTQRSWRPSRRYVCRLAEIAGAPDYLQLVEAWRALPRRSPPPHELRAVIHLAIEVLKQARKAEQAYARERLAGRPAHVLGDIQNGVSTRADQQMAVSLPTLIEVMDWVERELRGPRRTAAAVRGRG